MHSTVKSRLETPFFKTACFISYMKICFTESDSYVSTYRKRSNIMENFYENAALGFQQLCQLKVEKPIFIWGWQAGTISRAFQTVLAVQEVRFFFFRFLIISYKKLYRKQPVEFSITDHILWKNQT